MPTVFLAHGAPPALDDATWMAQWREWGRALGTPRAILMISAHWIDTPITLGATRTVPLVYDFYGFPERYYRVTYPAPSAPELASRVRELLGEPVRESERGLDHGAFVPLMGMYPDAGVPVLQISLPSEDPARLVELGRALAPLRDEGTLIVGSGFITHNLRAATFGAQPSLLPSWATDLDAWTADAVRRHDLDALIDYRARAPGVQMSLPTHEHFVPLLVAAGAARQGERATFPIEGWVFGPFTKRSVQWG
ncbi:MAG: dioxygenase [Sandaracinaceae bacterium]|nr:dioxygenase [Sandaracinaceae bacterium]